MNKINLKMGMGFLKCIGVEKFNFKKNFKPIEVLRKVGLRLKSIGLDF